MTGETARRRFTDHYQAAPEHVMRLSAAHPAVTEARSLFPTTVVQPQNAPRLLVSGHNQRKIGDRVTKGAWSGMPIFCLTLEERATCPSTCHHWLSCYGNGMPFSRRHAHGQALEYLLQLELAAKQQEHPSGFVLRLHILGDFYDAAYVALWRRWMDAFPALRVFGFTARDEASDEGILLRSLNRDYADRWVIRFSSPSPRNVAGVRYATTLWQVPETATVDGAVVCPAQTDKTGCCGTCAFCWTGTKTVAFIAHGSLSHARAAAKEDATIEEELTTIPPALPTAPAPAPRAQPLVMKRPPAPATPIASLAPQAARPVDPDHTVPLREIEIRAWLRSVHIDDTAVPLPDLLSTANKRRILLGLPQFTLIPPRLMTANEIILADRFSSNHHHGHKEVSA